MTSTVVAFVSGVLFAVGLGFGGMTQPRKVLEFLDPWNWDPSLLLVMVGAVSVHSAAYYSIRRRASPFLGGAWHLPTRRDLDWRLGVGAALFGLGWGLAGYCPGPGVVSLVAGTSSAWVFVATLMFGMWSFRLWERFMAERS